jgi:MSHA pilin protein MshD
MNSRARCRGVTLVELVVTIVIVAVAVGGVLGVLSAAAARSAENLVQAQAVLIAQSYLNEILDKRFGRDPCGMFIPTHCSRTQMNSVGDYDGLATTGVYDQYGNPYALQLLTQYRVSVNVSNRALGVIPSAQSELVAVTVVPPSGSAVVLSGYCIDYGGHCADKH